MLILGIDPGYAIVGWGVIEYKNSKFTAKDYGAVLTDSKDDFLLRLEKIYDRITEIIKIYNPDAISIEKLYFQNNHKTAIDVAQARGVTLLAAKKCGVPIFEYTPLQIKSALTAATFKVLRCRHKSAYAVPIRRRGRYVGRIITRVIRASKTTTKVPVPFVVDMDSRRR